MNTLLIKSLIVASIVVSTYAVFAQADPSLTAQMEACFRAHARLMDKPAIRNPRDCWRVQRVSDGKPPTSGCHYWSMT